MRRASIREPLVIYAVVMALVMSLAVLAFAGLALSHAARRAYARAVRQELALLARTGLMPSGPAHPDAEVELGLVTTASSALGLSLERVRAIARGDLDSPTIVVLPLEVPDDEVYLVARLPNAIPTSIALVELSRIMPPVLLVALVAAGVMAVLVYRQLLPPLRALREIAGEPLGPEGLSRPDAPNEIVEIAERFRDTTRALRAARERAEAHGEALERMQVSLIRASKLASVGRLAAGVAHEVGNPLAAVKGYLGLLQAGLPDEEREQALARSIRELDRIHATIKKLLTYARTGSELRVEPRPFPLRAPVDEALGLLRGHPALRSVRLHDGVPDDGLEVVGVGSHVAQVLVNLLLNAGHAMAEGPGAATPSVRLTRSIESGCARVEIADDGPGIPPAHHELVFDPFFTTKGPGEGTGLGLALARAMMEAMGGTLELVADGPPGATFVLALPLAVDAKAAAEGTAGPAEVRAPADPRPGP